MWERDSVFAVVVTGWVPLTHNNEEPKEVLLFFDRGAADEFASTIPRDGNDAVAYVLKARIAE